MLVSLQIQGGPQELASVLAAIGGISLPVEAPVMPMPVALPATETKQPRKSAAKQVAAPAPEPEPTAPVVDEAPADTETQSAAVQQTQPTEEPKGERLSLEKIRGVFNEKLELNRSAVESLMSSSGSDNLPAFYKAASEERKAEFFRKLCDISASQPQPQSPPKPEVLSFKGLQTLFHSKLSGNRDVIKQFFNDHGATGFTEFYENNSSEQHTEFFNLLSNL